MTDISEQANQIQVLENQTQHDMMTDLWNKGHFHQVLHQHCEQVRRSIEAGEPLLNKPRRDFLAIIDIDNFKQINDQFGHAAGDEVIKKVAHTVRSTLRSTDFIARIGGDEFATILTAIPQRTAILLMERICKAVAQLQNGAITVSIGIGDVGPDDKTTFTDADKALYQSKHSGKNCVAVHRHDHLTVVQNEQSQ